MQFFRTDATMFFFKIKYFFSNKNIKTLHCHQNLLIIGSKYFFFSTANWSKTSPNLIFCFIKNANLKTYVYIVTLVSSRTMQCTKKLHSQLISNDELQLV